MRGRAWRRHIEEKKVIRRLKNSLRYGSWWRFFDANGFQKRRPGVKEFIGTERAFRYKTHTTNKWDTKEKEKYSPNRTNTWWRYKKGNTREEAKAELLRILIENGIK